MSAYRSLRRVGGIVLLGVVGLIAWQVRTPPRNAEPAEEPKPPPSRWRRFRVDVAKLISGRAGDAIIAEEGGKGRMVLASGNLRDLPLEIGVGTTDPRLRIETKPLSFKTAWIARIDGRAWTTARPIVDGDLPALVDAKGTSSHDALPRSRSFSFHGKLAERDYEIRRDGKLVLCAMRTIDDEEPESGAYFVEIVKSCDALPVLSLVVIVELVAMHRGVLPPGVEPNE